MNIIIFFFYEINRTLLSYHVRTSTSFLKTAERLFRNKVFSDINDKCNIILEKQFRMRIKKISWEECEYENVILGRGIFDQHFDIDMKILTTLPKIDVTL